MFIFNTILLIDDDEASRLMVYRALQRAKIARQIFTAENGKEGLKIISLHPPDLIFLDINMPVMDGWEFVTAFEQLPTEQTARTSIVMLTTSLRYCDEQRANNSRVVRDFIEKPLTRRKIEQFVAHRRILKTPEVWQITQRNNTGQMNRELRQNRNGLES